MELENKFIQFYLKTYTHYDSDYIYSKYICYKCKNKSPSLNWTFIINTLHDEFEKGNLNKKIGN